MAKNKGKKPKGGAKRPNVYSQEQLPFDEPPNTDHRSPVFCLRHVQQDFAVRHADLQKEKRADFAEQLEKLASLTWAQIKLTGRHALGFEKLPTSQLKMTLPDAFEDEDHVLVFRYSGMHPMAGVRRGATFHLLALEREFGELYKH